METLANHKNLFVAFLLSCVLVATAFLLLSSDDTTPNTDVVANELADGTNQPTTDNSQFAAPEDVEAPDDGEPSKLPEPTQEVTEKPIIFTGFRKQRRKPLELDQMTSTTCTTDVRVECSLSFRNAETGDVVEFEPQETDTSGVTRWEWQGSDVGSGTWDITGTAGDKSSDTGVLYIQ